MTTEIEMKKFDWLSLLLGILFVIISLVAFRDPAGDLIAVVLFFAIFAIIKGVFELFVRYRMKEMAGSKSYSPIIIGIIDILIGIFLLLNMDVGLALLPFVFAIWFILDSVFGLLISRFLKTISEGYYWVTVVICVLGILLGVVLLFNPIFSLFVISFLVGFYFMLFGILNIIYAFRH